MIWSCNGLHSIVLHMHAPSKMVMLSSAQSPANCQHPVHNTFGDWPYQGAVGRSKQRHLTRQTAARRCLDVTPHHHVSEVPVQGFSCAMLASQLSSQCQSIACCGAQQPPSERQGTQHASQKRACVSSLQNCSGNASSQHGTLQKCC